MMPHLYIIYRTRESEPKYIRSQAQQQHTSNERSNEYDRSTYHAVWIAHIQISITLFSQIITKYKKRKSASIDIDGIFIW